MNDLELYQSQITENDVKRDCINLLVTLNFLVIRVNSGAVTQQDSQSSKKRHVKFYTWQAQGYPPRSAGVSDILALEPTTGRLWVIETKRPGKLENTTLSQEEFGQAAKERGAVFVVVDSSGMLEAIIRTLSGAGSIAYANPD